MGEPGARFVRPSPAFARAFPSRGRPRLGQPPGSALAVAAPEDERRLERAGAGAPRGGVSRVRTPLLFVWGGGRARAAHSDRQRGEPLPLRAPSDASVRSRSDPRSAPEPVGSLGSS